MTTVPQMGMVFGSPDEAYQYYRLYFRQLGFGITCRTSHNFYGVKYAVTFACTKNRKTGESNEDGFYKRARGLIGTGCKARVVVRDRLLRGTWTIEELELDHNHELSPDAVRLMRCHRALPLFVKKMLEINELAGLAQNKSIQAVFTQSGGVTQCHFTERDMRNYVVEVRRLQLKKGDAIALMKYFRYQQQKCPNFFYEPDVDDEGRLRNVFWVDARTRTSFKYFGDVVTFDTTYLTNRYKMPFAVFVGVNHHGQSILLGCVLLSNELKETFIWAFKTFKACMDNKAPEAMITDQCASIGNAIQEVFPNTRHRLCLWHIMKKLPEKLGGLTNRDEVIKDICKAVYDSETEADFDAQYLKLLEKVKDGHQFRWFQNLFNIKKMWVPVFLKRQFWADMSTTQRSEGMNAFFDNYVNSKTILKTFVQKYDVALHHKWEKELQEDFRCRQLQPKLVTNCTFEKQFAEVYTLRLFYQYQKEIKMLITCYCEHVPSQHPVMQLIVREMSGDRSFHVHFDVENCEYKCSCHLFEFRSIVCHHALCVYRQMGIDMFPAKYMVSRWRKDFIRSHIAQQVPDLPVLHGVGIYGATYAAANHMLLEILELATTSPELPDFLISRLQTLKNELIERFDHALLCTAKPIADSDDNQSDDNVVKDPVLTRSKGRPRSRRFKSAVESSTKNKRTSKRVPNTDQMGQEGIQACMPVDVVIGEQDNERIAHLPVPQIHSATQLLLACHAQAV